MSGDNTCHGRTLFRYFIKRGIDKGRSEAIYLLIKYFVWVVFIAAVLEMEGIQVTLLIVGSAALLVGLGFGLQQIFLDLVSGALSQKTQFDPLSHYERHFCK